MPTVDSLPIRVSCLMTCGRYANSYCRNQIEAAMHDAGLRLTCSLGVFYGQCMQTMMENVVADADVILTIDHDSIFNGGDVERILSRLMSDPAVDALAAMQARRGIAYPLFTLGCNEEVALPLSCDELFEVDTAHFGLTAIRAEKLRKVAKPWFYSKPSPSGSWNQADGKIDDDIWFWRQWRAAGNTIAIDPGCRIGHMEEMVSYYDSDMQLRYGYPADFAKARQKNDSPVNQAVGI